MRRRSITLHGDGTVTCWRSSAREQRRTPYDQVALEDVQAMRRIDLESFARAYPRIRASLPERTHARVQMSFVLELPLGEIIPSPTMEAIEAAALAVAGPVQLMPGSRISVQRAGSSAPGAPSVTFAAPRPPLDHRVQRMRKLAHGMRDRSLDQDCVKVFCATGHVSSDCAPVGYMSLKEAGAGLTVLAYRCQVCFRDLYVTEQPPVARAAGVDISAQDDVE